MSHIRCVAIQVSVSPSLMSTSRLTGGPREGLDQGCQLRDTHMRCQMLIQGCLTPGCQSLSGPNSRWHGRRSRLRQSSGLRQQQHMCPGHTGFFFFDSWFYSVFLLLHVYLKLSMLCMQSYIIFVLFFLFFLPALLKHN